MTADHPITDILGAPLGPDWTVDGLAEQVLGAIVARGPGEGTDVVLDADATTDRQVRRLLRPLLACLATKSAAEAGRPVNLYEGHFCFKRAGADGPVWIVGQFENRPGRVRITLHRSSSPPAGSEAGPRNSAAPTGGAARGEPSLPNPLSAGDRELTT